MSAGELRFVDKATYMCYNGYRNKYTLRRDNRMKNKTANTMHRNIPLLLSI